MQIQEFISKEYIDPISLNEIYTEEKPYPHIVLDKFIKDDLLESILDEFPDLSKLDSKVDLKDLKENLKQMSFFTLWHYSPTGRDW